MFSFKTLLTALALLASSLVYGLELDVSTEYRLGDSDSKVTARHAASQILRRQAADSVGSVISGMEQISNGEYIQSTIALTEALVKLNNIEERYTYNADNSLTLYMTARAVIEESAVAQRMSALKSSRINQVKLAEIADSNRKIEQQLNDIRLKATVSELTPDDAKYYADLTASLQTNHNNIHQIFTKGDLLKAADSNANASANIVNRFINHAKLVPLTAKPMDARYEGEYVKVDVLVTYPYKTPLVPSIKERKAVGVSESILKAITHLTSDSKAVFDAMTKQVIYGEITLAGVTTKFPLIYPAETFGGSTLCMSNPDTTTAEYLNEIEPHWIKPRPRSTMLTSKYAPCINSGPSRVITFTLTKTQAARADSVKTRLVHFTL